jgi:hypothetical protein
MTQLDMADDVPTPVERGSMSAERDLLSALSAEREIVDAAAKTGAHHIRDARRELERAL